MRQGQPQNRQRSRGRGNNNRNNNNNNRNNLNRSMESNGPEVRIRGTAAHIAEKYQHLARDAQLAGDNVAAESYWQHAEHYNRLISVAQAQQAQQREERAQHQSQQNTDTAEGAAQEDGDDNRSRNRSHRNRNETRSDEPVAEVASFNGDGPQPTLDEAPAELVLKDEPVVADKDAGSDEEPAPRKRTARRPRKKAVEEAAPVAAEAQADLPSFISGAAEE